MPNSRRRRPIGGWLLQSDRGGIKSMASPIEAFDKPGGNGPLAIVRRVPEAARREF